MSFITVTKTGSKGTSVPNNGPVNCPKGYKAADVISGAKGGSGINRPVGY